VLSECREFDATNHAAASSSGHITLKLEFDYFQRVYVSLVAKLILEFYIFVILVFVK